MSPKTLLAYAVNIMPLTLCGDFCDGSRFLHCALVVGDNVKSFTFNSISLFLIPAISFSIGCNGKDAAAIKQLEEKNVKLQNEASEFRIELDISKKEVDRLRSEKVAALKQSLELNDEVVAWVRKYEDVHRLARIQASALYTSITMLNDVNFVAFAASNTHSGGAKKDFDFILSTLVSSKLPYQLEETRNLRNPMSSEFLQLEYALSNAGVKLLGNLEIDIEELVDKSTVHVSEQFKK